MRSLRFQIFSLIVALLFVMLLVMNTYPVRSSRDTVFEEKKSSIYGQASTLSASLSSMETLSAESIQEVLRLLDITGYERVLVTDAEGSAVYDSAPLYGALPAQEIERALIGKNVFRCVFRDAAFYSACAMPFSGKSGINGAVYLSELDRERGEIIVNVQREMLTISIIVVAVAIVSAALLSNMMVSRISELVKSIRIVAGGDYSHRLETRGRDEITELGNEFNQLTERLDSTEKQRRRFVSDASHELKTPLASIRLLADSIVQTEDMDSLTMREFVTDIGNEAERLQHTTEKLLDLSRLDDDVQVVPEPVDLKQIAIDALSTLQPLADDHGIKVLSHLEDGCVIMATGDDMFHVIFNLLENAVKYNVPDGSVTITVNGDKDTVRVTVEDTGIGIPEEDRLNIFSRFYRVDKARSREAGGSGLGLSIVHDAVLAHGGSIAVGTNKPQGSRFIVSFPRPSEEETGI